MRNLCILVLVFCGARHAQAEINHLMKDAGMPLMDVAFSSKDLRAQERQFPSILSGEEALKIALQVILYDANDIESPLSLFLEGKEDLLFGLNRPSAQLFLVQSDTKYEERKPEHGEKVSGNWIFCLSLPDFSDHLFWVVIDRRGARDPYVYGFN